MFQAEDGIRDVAVTGVQTCAPSRRRHTRCSRDWSSDVCSSDLPTGTTFNRNAAPTLPTTGDTIIVLETYDNATSFAGIQVWRSVE